MLLSHTPSGAAAPDLIFCARLPVGQQHQPATRTGAPAPCPHPCAGACPLQRGACIAPPALPAHLALALSLRPALLALLAPGLTPPLGCVVFRN